MRSAIIGLTGAGKQTVFEALTCSFEDHSSRTEARIGTIRVPDERVDVLSRMYRPRKTTYAQVEYFLPGAHADKGSQQGTGWSAVRDCDALIHVVRNFSSYGTEPPSPWEDFNQLDQELIIADLIVAEKRLERLTLDQKRGKNIDPEELTLLQACVRSLEAEIPLRRDQQLADAHRLKGFAFLSAKPMLVLLNNEDDDDSLPDLQGLSAGEFCQVIRGKLEHELAQMSTAETQEFLKEFNIPAAATDRVITASYDLLGLISFFTVGDDEVRAWTIGKNTRAVDAAGVIHSDMQKGFIRAEVLSYGDLIDAGSYAAARKQGTVRLEGKTYEVQDGDIVQIRFNV
ncbi:MAG: GTP-binding protein [Deltaproteobacteria bacterium SG8_13]|nr:MAG: GTP-binding protein [Deltaproteobacteria bacterium SG8_13]